MSVCKHPHIAYKYFMAELIYNIIKNDYIILLKVIFYFIILLIGSWNLSKQK